MVLWGVVMALQGVIMVFRAVVTVLQGVITALWGVVMALRGVMPLPLRGVVTALRGVVTGVRVGRVRTCWQNDCLWHHCCADDFGDHLQVGWEVNVHISRTTEGADYNL